MMTYDLRYVNFKDVFAGYNDVDLIVFHGTSGDNQFSLMHPYEVLKDFINHIREINCLDMEATMRVLSALDCCIGDGLYINFEVK